MGRLRRAARSLCAAAALGLCLHPARAADEVVTVSGDAYTGAASIDSGTVTVAGQSVRMADVVSIRFAEEATFAAANPGVVTAGGDVISGTVSDLSEGSLAIASEILGTVKMPRERLRLIVLQPKGTLKLTGIEPGFEGVILSNDDRAKGEITWMSADEIGVKTASGIFRIPRKRAAIVALAVAAPGGAAPAGARFFARLLNGDLLGLESPRLDASKLSFKSGLGSDVAVDRKLLYEMYAAGGNVVHLSDVAPARAEHIPQFDASFPHKVDASVEGGVLRVGKRCYLRGFGVHSKSVLEFDLGGQYSILLAEIGVDEEVGERGSVVFSAKTDGKEVFTSGLVTGSDGPRRIKVQLAGAGKLTLEVDFGPDGADTGDHADWCMPVLVRK